MWTQPPDFVSVNWAEDGAQELALDLSERGVGIEAGLFSSADVQTWAESSMAARCVRAMVELLDGEDEATALDLIAMVRAAHPQA